MNDSSKIAQIYRAALEQEPAGRDKFLDKICGDNEELRREVESLLFFARTGERIY